jgi:hypothetical protein
MRRYCVRLNVVSVCLIGFFISAYAPSAGAQSYTFKTIDDPNAAGSPAFDSSLRHKRLGGDRGKVQTPPFHFLKDG